MPTGKSRILIATSGTWGDLLPFVALGNRLESRGHDVTLACASGMQEWVRRAGLKAVTFDGDFGKEKAQMKARHWDQWAQCQRSPEPNKIARKYQSLVKNLERNARVLAKHAVTHNLIVSPTNCPEGRLAHELTGIAWQSVILVPEDALEPKDTVDEACTAAMNDLLKRLELSLPFHSLRRFKRSTPTLFACSRSLGATNDPELRQTGFWFYEDPGWRSWKPDADLIRFMEDDEAPLVLSFSSLPLENPEKTLEVHVRAARILNRRLVIQKGWAGFSKGQLPIDIDQKRIYFAEFLPHDWFFTRAAALITHGGIGTLGRAIRQRCPLIIEPYGNDQFFNSLLVKRLGFGAVVHPHRLTPEGLAEVIHESALNAEVRANLSRAANVIGEEDGLSDACIEIEKRLDETGAVA